MVWPLMPGSIVANGTAIKLAGLLPLAAILYGAVRVGLRERRIPNQLVLAGIAAGVLLHSALPEGNGLLVDLPGGVGPWQSLRGLATGAVAMLPFYSMRAVGAGAVKLMAAIGAILGPSDVVPVILGTLLAGGAVALAVTLRRRCAGALIENLVDMARRASTKTVGSAERGGAIRSVAEAPYVLAVAIGTLGGVLWVLSGAYPG